MLPGREKVIPQKQINHGLLRKGDLVLDGTKTAKA